MNIKLCNKIQQLLQVQLHFILFHCQFFVMTENFDITKWVSDHKFINFWQSIITMQSLVYFISSISEFKRRNNCTRQNKWNKKIWFSSMYRPLSCLWECSQTGGQAKKICASVKQSHCSVLHIGCIPTDVKGVYTFSPLFKRNKSSSTLYTNPPWATQSHMAILFTCDQ